MLYFIPQPNYNTMHMVKCWLHFYLILLSSLYCTHIVSKGNKTFSRLIKSYSCGIVCTPCFTVCRNYTKSIKDLSVYTPIVLYYLRSSFWIHCCQIVQLASVLLFYGIWHHWTEISPHSGHTACVNTRNRNNTHEPFHIRLTRAKNYGE